MSKLSADLKEKLSSVAANPLQTLLDATDLVKKTSEGLQMAVANPMESIQSVTDKALGTTQSFAAAALDTTKSLATAATKAALDKVVSSSSSSDQASQQPSDVASEEKERHVVSRKSLRKLLKDQEAQAARRASEDEAQAVIDQESEASAALNAAFLGLLLLLAFPKQAFLPLVLPTALLYPALKSFPGLHDQFPFPCRPDWETEQQQGYAVGLTLVLGLQTLLAWLVQPQQPQLLHLCSFAALLFLVLPQTQGGRLIFRRLCPFLASPEP
jgi:hypothetical protein